MMGIFDMFCKKSTDPYNLVGWFYSSVFIAISKYFLLQFLHNISCWYIYLFMSLASYIQVSLSYHYHFGCIFFLEILVFPNRGPGVSTSTGNIHFKTPYISPANPLFPTPPPKNNEEYRPMVLMVMTAWSNIKSSPVCLDCQWNS